MRRLMETARGRDVLMARAFFTFMLVIFFLPTCCLVLVGLWVPLIGLAIPAIGIYYVASRTYRFLTT